MVENNTSSLSELEQNFKDLLIEQCGKLPTFSEYLVEHPDFEFPKITEELLESSMQGFIFIPGLFGGYAYYVEVVNNEPVLYAEQSSRMDYSDDDYLYFEITESGSRMLRNEEREAVQKKFRELTKKAHEKHLQELKAIRKKAEE